MEATILLELTNITHGALGAMGTWQIALIALAILLLFGGSKIPELMKGFGSGIKEFKKGLKEDDKEDDKEEKKK